jgi:hypothetical protein
LITQVAELTAIYAEEADTMRTKLVTFFLLAMSVFLERRSANVSL